MPSYAKPASALGGALGGGLGGLLGQLSGIADMPRQALWSLFGEDRSGSDIVSDVLGTERGGLASGILGTGLEMALDPLSWTGLLGGALKGLKFGKGLEAAAIARGPRYGGGWSKITAAGIPLESSATREILDYIKMSPGLDKILGEIPEGSRYLGAGAEAIALKTPTGDVLRLEPLLSKPGLDSLIARGYERPNIPEMLQATRAGKAGNVRIERVPFVETKGISDTPKNYINTRYKIAPGLEEQVRSHGYVPADVHPGNIGKLGDEVKILDPGAIYPGEGSPALPALRDLGESPGFLKSKLLDLLGSDQAIQRELAGGVSDVAERVPSSFPGSLTRAFRARFGY